MIEYVASGMSKLLVMYNFFQFLKRELYIVYSTVIFVHYRIYSIAFECKKVSVTINMRVVEKIPVF